MTAPATIAFDAATAARFADIALANIAREFPHKLDHVIGSVADVVAPLQLHPAFHGSYDWHSCVHMHWLLAHARRRFPDLPGRDAIDALFDRHFAPDAVGAEVSYLRRPDSVTFERPYGWAWLLKLALELRISAGADALRWARALQPLAAVFAQRYLGFLPRARFPIRYGMHANSAFGLVFALDFARETRNDALEAACVAKAREWYASDRAAPAEWEPSGADFLSPVLIEAELMRRVLDREAFGVWLAGFMPGMAARAPATLFTPVAVSDRGDAQIVHLDGLNLSRAWCFAGMAAALPPGDPRVSVAREAAAVHIAAGWQGLASEEFAGMHWLASFAALALDAQAALS